MRGRGYQVPGAGTLSLGGSIDMGGTTNTAYRHRVSADGKNLYLLNYNNQPAGISQYTRDVNTGLLTPMTPATLASGFNPAFMIESPDGKFMYVSCDGSNYVKPLARNATTGALVYNSGTAPNASTGGGPHGMVMDKDGLNLYCACRTGNVVSQFSRNATTGALTALSPTTFAPASAFGIRGIDITKNPSSGIAGKYIYTGSFGVGMIHCMVRDTSTGLLSANPTQAAYTIGGQNAEPAWLVISPDDKHLYAAYDGTAKLGAFAINQADGSLTLIDEYPGGNGPWQVAITPNGLNVYVAGSDGQTIMQYTRDPATGVLTAKTPSFVRSDPYFTVTTGSEGPQFVAVAPEGRHLYANNSKGNWSLAMFDIHP